MECEEVTGRASGGGESGAGAAAACIWQLLL